MKNAYCVTGVFSRNDSSAIALAAGNSTETLTAYAFRYVLLITQYA
jgi:hypothetical protein